MYIDVYIYMYIEVYIYKHVDVYINMCMNVYPSHDLQKYKYIYIHLHVNTYPSDNMEKKKRDCDITSSLAPDPKQKESSHNNYKTRKLTHTHLPSHTWSGK